MKFKEVIPLTLEDFLIEFGDSEAAKYLEVEVIEEHGWHKQFHKHWDGKHKNVNIWWFLANGKKVGFNENPARGWSFPVIGKLKVETQNIPVIIKPTEGC